MHTIVETAIAQEDADALWSEDERGEFCAWIAARPNAGKVIPKSGGCRKVRWAREGMGKQGGVRVIYFNRLQTGRIWILMVYAKSERDNISPQILARIREEIENADQKIR